MNIETLKKANKLNDKIKTLEIDLNKLNEIVLKFVPDSCVSIDSTFGNVLILDHFTSKQILVSSIRIIEETIKDARLELELL